MRVRSARGVRAVPQGVCSTDGARALRRTYPRTPLYGATERVTPRRRGQRAAGTVFSTAGPNAASGLASWAYASESRTSTYALR